MLIPQVIIIRQSFHWPTIKLNKIQAILDNNTDIFLKIVSRKTQHVKVERKKVKTKKDKF